MVECLGEPFHPRLSGDTYRIRQLKHADTHRFRTKCVDGVVSYKKIRKVVKDA
nr:MAG TPA: hypothetical protein [Caudoviricetes sp.]